MVFRTIGIFLLLLRFLTFFTFFFKIQKVVTFYVFCPVSYVFSNYGVGTQLTTQAGARVHTDTVSVVFHEPVYAIVLLFPIKIYFLLQEKLCRSDVVHAVCYEGSIVRVLTVRSKSRAVSELIEDMLDEESGYNSRARPGADSGENERKTDQLLLSFFGFTQRRRHSHRPFCHISRR